MTMTSYVGTAHGKIILIGEHSAVHFKPAIVLPLASATIEATLVPHTNPDSSEITIDCEYFSGLLADAPQSLDNIKELIRVLRSQGLISNGFDLIITSQIPRERGMGSSAAVAVAIVRAVAAFAGVTLTSRQVFDYTQVAENIAHSNASGMDAATTATDNAVWFLRGEELSDFKVECDGVLVIADTGIKGGTREAVSAVHDLLYSSERGVARITAERIDRLGELTEVCAQALKTNDIRALGVAMNEAHSVLCALTVSDPKLDELVAAARSAGALGAKLTGGGRGGCMIALAADNDSASKISSALMVSGATNTWILPLKDSRSSHRGFLTEEAVSE